MRALARLGFCSVSIFTCATGALAAAVHHYVFFNRDRERIADASFLSIKALEGAQLKYTWRELERQKDQYDFGEIRRDLSFLQSKGKKLFVQLQDASFDTNVVPIPPYLVKDARYHGGADLQYTIESDDEKHAAPQGWVARRWDSAVQVRFHRLLLALGREFDGQIEGINLSETAVDFGESGKLFPKGFTPVVYRNAVLTNMMVLKRAFPRSVSMQYANFMPGGQPNLLCVYRWAKELKLGVGTPDLLPYKPGQMRNCYPLIQESSGAIPTGIAVQDGNYEYRNPRTGQRVTVPELVEFASRYLGVNYIFWCTQEPYYSQELLPFLQAQR
ncbi:MAG TPA: hypothetical protein VNZ64_17380 [Candidatus Acidoferrum sp.]|jgi:hypothetical protein|nr:hypothetical protein [Candidatus Acidoferrum sp.]